MNQRFAGDFSRAGNLASGYDRETRTGKQCYTHTPMEPKNLRERLRDLNTKAYCLPVAPTFVSYWANPKRSSKWALSLTALVLVAVLPVQDCAKTVWALEVIRWSKVVLLTLALGFIFFWIFPVSS